MESSLQRFDSQLRKNELVTQKMLSTLSSFDERLHRLESRIIPIYSSTQRYDQIDKNVFKSLEYVNLIVSYMDLVEEQDLNINRGPQEDNIEPYLETMNKIKFALDSLLEMNIPNIDKSLNLLRSLYKRAVTKVDSVFRTWLSLQTITVDPKSISNRKGKEGFQLPEETLKRLAKLSQVLTLTRDRAVPSQYSEIYIEIRSFYIDKSLQVLSSECIKQHGQAGKHKSFYEKGKHPFMTYTSHLIEMFQAEKKNILFIFHSEKLADDISSIYGKTIRPALSTFLQTGEGILRSKSSSINCKEFADILELLDLSGFLTAFISDHEDVFSDGRVTDLVNKYASAAMNALTTYLKDLEKPANRYPTVPVEATVHEISTDTVNFLTKLENYQDIVESMLEKLNFGSFTQYIVQVLKQLNDAVIKLATLYKEDVKGVIFALNNNHYILKALKKSGYDSLLSEEKLLEKYSAAIGNILKRYLKDWELIIGPCRNLDLAGNNKMEKDPIKDICKNFLTLFEETVKLQKSLSIPDYELRMNIIREIKDLVTPVYSNFYDRYRAANFTKNLSKYLKYEPNEIEDLLGSLFEG